MADIQALECRIYMAEDEMYEASSELNRLLHEIEHEVRTLADRITELVCRSGRVPTDVKAPEITGRIRTVLGQLDLTRVEEGARKVGEMKTEIEGYERETAIQRHPSARLEAAA